MRSPRDWPKRVFDLVLATMAIVVFAVPMAVVAVAVVVALGRPVFFVQERPGRDSRLFRLYKFRTMRDAVSPDGQQLPDAERLTALGRFLRSTSLDELPELFNVLKGDMSLVGPRPLLPQYLPRYTSEQARRHEVRPGITGLAQVSGRNALLWEEKFELDVRYVDTHSLWLDVRILARTLVKTLRREDISQPGSATMEEFLPGG